jgi:hypothetical protein
MAMKDLSTVRMVTTNFSTLQGLKMVPFGSLLLVVSLWANAQTGPARDFLYPGTCIVLAFFLYLLIVRYYNLTFGSVSPTHRQRSGEVIRSLVGGVVGLGAFLVDVYLRPPFSTLGVILAGVIGAEYIRLTWKMKWVAWLFYPNLAAFLLLVGLSLMPVFGVTWWKPVGIKALMLGVTTITGFLFILIGILDHFLLAQWLSPLHEVNHEQRI